MQEINMLYSLDELRGAYQEKSQEIEFLQTLHANTIENEGESQLSKNIVIFLKVQQRHLERVLNTPLFLSFWKSQRLGWQYQRDAIRKYNGSNELIIDIATRFHEILGILQESYGVCSIKINKNLTK